MFMTGYIFPKWLLQYLSFNVFILQCNSNSPIKKWDLCFHVCGWTYGYGGSDTLWLLWLVHKGMIQLPASVKMFPMKLSFHAVRKPKSHCGVAPLKRIWHQNVQSYEGATCCRRGTSCSSEADAKWRETTWLHWTVFKWQVREQNTWLLSFKPPSLGCLVS